MKKAAREGAIPMIRSPGREGASSSSTRQAPQKTFWKTKKNGYEKTLLLGKLAAQAGLPAGWVEL